MIRLLEVAGFALIGGTIYAFLAPVLAGGSSNWPLFWACAIGAVGIILYRNHLRKARAADQGGGGA